MLSKDITETVAKNRSITTSIFVVMLMVMSTTLTMMASPSYEASVEFKEVDGVAVPMTAGQLTHQGGPKVTGMLQRQFTTFQRTQLLAI